MNNLPESQSNNENLNQASLPDGFEEAATHRHHERHIDMPLEQYLEHEKEEFFRHQAMERNSALRYQPSPSQPMTPCGNGDFEKELDATQWQGAFGSLPLNTPSDFANQTTGINSGSITDFNAHQTWVGAGSDPNVGIPTTAQGSSGAVRIGNAVNGFGCELLSKTFIVTPLLKFIRFWYAVVMQNPLGHGPNEQPFFEVRVTDAVGNIVPGAFDFGSGSDRLIADASNPFFQTTTQNGETIVYKDWSCAQLDLSSQVGQQVTVEFITGDCGFGGHWGYAYVDNFCGNCQGSPTGDLTYDCESSTHCGLGQICFNYALPQTAGNTGSVTIVLDIYQNGVLLTQISTNPLTSGDRYCFTIDPATIPGLNLSLGGFDFSALGTFNIGNTHLGQIHIGSAPDGIDPGLNNDYQIACRSCVDIKQEQNAYLSEMQSHKVNLLKPASCDCPENTTTGCGSGCTCIESEPDDYDGICDCTVIEIPVLQPCISVSWGDSKCDCLETDDLEVMFITVCNPYSNVQFNGLTIGQITVTDIAGNPVPTLPNGTASVQVTPSGPICFGDLGPCNDQSKSSCTSRELVLRTRGAIGQNYRLSFDGICFSVTNHYQSEQCFTLNLCQD